MEGPREIGEWIAVSDLGAGSFGVVQLWKNRITDEFIAVKKCRFSLPAQLSKRQKERWTNEVKMMQTIRNPNIVSFKKLPDVLDMELSKYNHTKLPLLSMEYCSKGNLRTCLQQPQNVRGMRESEARHVLTDMGSAVSYLHGMNVTHRDIKPENIVLQETNQRSNGTIYKLIDLGYAKELETLVQSFVGTLQYVAPEIVKTENYTNKVDYWSLGVVAFEIITAVHPFLHQLHPTERFQYIEQKSPESICIRLDPNGTVKYFNQIVYENHVTEAFRTNVESWLQLVLQYDPNMRGVRHGETKNVFEELKTVLTKMIIKVFSVFHYKHRSYEITDDTRISDVKAMIGRDFDISEDDQLLLAEIPMLKYESNMRLVDCFYEINHDTTLFLFKKGKCIDQKDIELSDLTKKILGNGQKEIDRNTLKYFYYAHGIHFVSQEHQLLNTLKTCCLLQMDRLDFLFVKEEELFAAVRDSLSKLTAQIECHVKVNQKFVDVMDESDEKSLRNLIEYRKYLRQSKELVENVNALTARNSVVRAKRSLLIDAAEKLRKFLDGNTDSKSL